MENCGMMPVVEYIELENSNHIFSGQNSQESLKQDIFNWLEKNRKQ